MKKSILILVFLFFSSESIALQYCSGTVKRIVTRDNSEATEFKLQLDNGTESGWARIGTSGAYTEAENVQVSMLLAAFMSDQSVSIELWDEGFRTCSDFDRGVPLRNISMSK